MFGGTGLEGDREEMEQGDPQGAVLEGTEASRSRLVREGGGCRRRNTKETWARSSGRPVAAACLERGEKSWRG
jgi:hypothetical protein